MVFEKDNVVLRRFNDSDKSQLAQLANNKKVWDNLRDYIPYPYYEKDAANYIEHCQLQNPSTNFAIEYNDQLTGSIGLIPQQDVYRKSAELGYWIGENFWGKGITTTAVELITNYGFYQLELVRIYAGIFSFNLGSQRVLEKNGFTKEGIFKKAIIKNGKIWDEIRFGKIK